MSSWRQHCNRLFMEQVLPILGKHPGASEDSGAVAAGFGPPQPEAPRGSGHLRVKRRRFTSVLASASAAKSNTEKFTEGAALVSICLLLDKMRLHSEIWY